MRHWLKTMLAIGERPEKSKKQSWSDTPKEATLINDKDLEAMKPLEPTRF